MEVICAKSAGFCFGVRRAIDCVYSEIEKGGRIFTYGPIIHNDQVVADLESKGVEIINSPDQFDKVGRGTVIIRSHGVSWYVIHELESRNIKYVDMTCPFVQKIHKIVSEESSKGRKIVIAGDAGHPEVTGIMGWSSSPVSVIGTEDEARAFEALDDDGEKKELCIVSQTTFNSDKFKDIVEIIKKKDYNCNAVNTICNATQERQSEAASIAVRVDAMIVIGGLHSSNTEKLYEICRERCTNTYFIQTLDDLHFNLPKSVRLVGITAGASTPNNIIEEVQNYVRINF